MGMQLRQILNKIRYIRSGGGDFTASKMSELYRLFPLFTPNSACSSKLVASELAVQTINQIFPLLRSFSLATSGKHAKVRKPVELLPESGDSISELKKLFDHYGSDKADGHDYHDLYGRILNDRM